MSRSIFAFVTALVLFTQGLCAAVIHVPADYPTIQDAVDASVNGDVIQIAGGTWYENIDIISKGIVLQGSQVKGQPTVIDGSAMTQGPTQGSTIRCVKNASGLAFYDLMITGGTGTPGLGTHSSPNPNSLLGGGVYCEDASPEFSRCAIFHNTAFDGAGVFCRIGSPRFMACTFKSNYSANAVKSGGGAINCSECEVYIARCRFDNNRGDAGGALRLIDSRNVIEHCTFESNKGRIGGAVGIFCWNTSPLSIIHGCHFTSNQANLPSYPQIPSSCSFGGAVHQFGGELDLVSCHFISNECEQLGGALSQSTVRLNVRHCEFHENHSDINGGAISCGPVMGTNLVIGSVFTMNTAGGMGGAVFGTNVNSASPRIQFWNTQFSLNESVGRGGAVRLLGGQGSPWATIPLRSFVNCIVSDNVSGLGAAIDMEQFSGDVANCTIVNNTGDGIRFGSTSISQLAVISNTVIHGNSVAQITAPNSNMQVSDCIIEGGLAFGTNVQDVDPELIFNGNTYGLMSSSPCLDAGDPFNLPSDEQDLDNDGDLTEAIPVDLLYQAREQDGDGDGLVVVDIGAIEVSSAICSADLNMDGVVDLLDLIMLIAQWGTSGSADLNNDGVVDILDLMTMTSLWGPCP